MTGKSVTSRPYHHGDLRRVLLAAAITVIEESGPAALRLRDLARRAEVSHAAPAYHFGDKAGLLTALAAQGYDLLAAQLARALEQTGELLEVGVAYVRFAVGHRAHFEVMFRPDLYHRDDAELTAARERAFAVLRTGLATLPNAPATEQGQHAGLAAWSIVHGFATLWLGNALPPEVGKDPEAAARVVIRRLFENT